MLNGYDSWHDSDDIDSETEQEVYSLLYYNNCEKNESDIKSFIIENEEKLKSHSDIEEMSINLVDSSDSVVEKKTLSDSDSDDLKYIPPIRCSKGASALYIGSSSESSDVDEVKLIDDDSSLLINVSIGNTTNNTQKINSLFPKFNTYSPIAHGNENWTVNHTPLLKSKYGSRYFDISTKSVCQVCSKKGHSEDQCTRTGPICILCGKEGHMSKKCVEAVCFICYQLDHSTKKCPYISKFLRQDCRRCGQRGHSGELCPDVWRQYKYTIKSGPPVFKQCSSQNKSTVFCANCAKPGHFTEQCPRSRMNSKFLGPPPIMEIIQFDDYDIYQRAGLSYITEKPTKNSTEDEVEFPSFINRMDLTEVIQDDSVQLMEPIVIDLDSDTPTEVKDSQFGDGIIMLSPIKKPTRKSKINDNKQDKVSRVECSTPRGPISRVHKADQSEQLSRSVKTPTKLPGITTELLKKLFPEETADHDKLPPALRKKLRKKLKNLIDHGYLPGDANMTQERMEFWLQEISTGRSLNYREKKKLLGSVSAALHSISDRVSNVEMLDSESSMATKGNVDPNLSIPELRRQRNRNMRESKSLKNKLKLSRKERQSMSDKLELPIKSRLRNQTTTDGDAAKETQKKKSRKRRRKSAAPEIILIE